MTQPEVTSVEGSLHKALFYYLQPLLLVIVIGGWYWNPAQQETYLLTVVFVQLLLGFSEHYFPARPAWSTNATEKTRNVVLVDQAARDIAGITVNRWPHGYAYSVDAESGDVAWWPEAWQHERRPWVDARQRVGNIAFAGTDAASNAMTESAIEEAHRAVHSLGTQVAKQAT